MSRTASRTLLPQLLSAAGADPGDGDWSFTLTHVGEGGWAQVFGSSRGDLRATYTSELLVEGDQIITSRALPPLEDVRQLRKHFDRCVEASGLAPWNWAQILDVGPYGSTVNIYRMPRHARNALQAWWLGAEPIRQEPPPTRFEAFVPSGTTATARKSLLAAFKILDQAENAEGWPTKRIQTFSQNPLLVRTLIGWVGSTPDRDTGYLLALNILAVEGSTDALGAIERRVAEILGSEPDLRALWEMLAVLREARPAHPLVATLASAWSKAFAPTVGGRLLTSMGVTPPTDADWEVVLMGRQDDERTHLYRGDCIIEIYPHGFFRANVNIAGPQQEAATFAMTPEPIERCREHFDRCAREAKLKPWNFAARWHPENMPNGGIVTVKGFAKSDNRKITNWFRGWRSAE